MLLATEPATPDCRDLSGNTSIWLPGSPGHGWGSYGRSHVPCHEPELEPAFSDDGWSVYGDRVTARIILMGQGLRGLNSPRESDTMRPQVGIRSRRSAKGLISNTAYSVPRREQ